MHGASKIGFECGHILITNITVSEAHKLLGSQKKKVCTLAENKLQLYPDFYDAFASICQRFICIITCERWVNYSAEVREEELLGSKW